MTGGYEYGDALSMTQSTAPKTVFQPFFQSPNRLLSSALTAATAAARTTAAPTWAVAAGGAAVIAPATKTEIMEESLGGLPYIGSRTDQPGYEELMRVGEGLGLSDGMLIAGGAVRRAELDIPLSGGDIDVYVQSGADSLMEDAQRFLGARGELVERQHTKDGEKEWGRVYEIRIDDETHRVQLIQFQRPYDPTTLLKSFDLTCVQGAYEPFTKRLWRTARFADDNKTRTLRWVKLRSIFATLARMEKYVTLGYTMEAEERRRIGMLMASGAIPAGGSSDPYTEGADF